MIKSTVVAVLTCAMLAACGGQQTPPAADPTSDTSSAATNSAAADTSTSVPAATSAATPTTAAPAADGATIPAAYQGHWSTTEYGCTSPANSGRHFTINATGFQDLFRDSWTARGVTTRGGGIVVDATKCSVSATPCPPSNTARRNFTFATSADGATMTYTDPNNISTPYRRCPATAAPAG